MKQPDPLGKRALFSVISDEPPPASGPRQLLMGLPLEVTIRCSACDAVRTTSLTDLVIHALPLWFWMPGRKPGHLLRCASCGQIAWQDISRAG